MGRAITFAGWVRVDFSHSFFARFAALNFRSLQFFSSLNSLEVDVYEWV